MIEREDTGYIFKAGNKEEIKNVIRKIDNLFCKQYDDMRRNVVDKCKETFSRKAYLNRFTKCLQKIILKLR